MGSECELQQRLSVALDRLAEARASELTTKLRHDAAKALRMDLERTVNTLLIEADKAAVAA